MTHKGCDLDHEMRGWLRISQICAGLVAKHTGWRAEGRVVAGFAEASNIALERSAGSHALAAAAQRECSAQILTVGVASSERLLILSMAESQP